MIVLHLGYLDPGSGSMLLQVIFGGLLGATYVGRKFLARLWFGFAKLLKAHRRTQKSGTEAGD